MSRREYWSRLVSGEKCLLRRDVPRGTATPRWKGYDKIIGTWREFQPDLRAVVVLEEERRNGVLIRVAAMVLGGVSHHA